MTSRSDSSPEPQPAETVSSRLPPTDPRHPGPARFGRSRRLRSSRQFTTVYASRVSERAGPLVIYALPNDLPHARLGLSLPRRVGRAVARNRIKRLLREVFRHHQSDLPRGYDFVINVRGHEPLSRDEYESLLCGAMQRLHQRWVIKCRKQESRRSDSRQVEAPSDGG